VETRTLQDVKKVMKTGKVDRIMLDDFTTDNIERQWILSRKMKLRQRDQPR
jgi:nicotinate-nucleotide pyrophosphorylase